MFQRDSIEELHGDEGLLVLLADFVDGADVRMVEAEAERASRRKRSSAWGSPGEILGKKLQGDKATEAQFFGLVNDAHAATAKLSHDAIMGDGAAGTEYRRSADWRSLAAARDARAATSSAGVRRKLPASLRLSSKERTSRSSAWSPGHACRRNASRSSGRTLQHRLQQAVDLFPSLGVHRLSRRSIRDRARPWRCSSRASP